MISRRPKRGRRRRDARHLHDRFSRQRSAVPLAAGPWPRSLQERSSDSTRDISRLSDRVSRASAGKWPAAAAARPISFRFHFTATVSRRTAFPRSSRSAPSDWQVFFQNPSRDVGHDIRVHYFAYTTSNGNFAANSIARGKPRRGHSSE